LRSGLFGMPTTDWQFGIARRLGINNIPLPSRDMLHRPEESEWIYARQAQTFDLMFAPIWCGKSNRCACRLAGWNIVNAFGNTVGIR